MSDADKIHRVIADREICGDPADLCLMLYDHLAVLLAVEAGEVSQGRARTVAGLDIVDLRERMAAVIRHGKDVAGVPSPPRFSVSERSM